MKKLLILPTAQSEARDLNLAAMVSFLGAKVELLDPEAFAISLSTQAPDPHNSFALVLHADALANLYARQDSSPCLRERLLRTQAFLYGVRAKVHDEILQWLTGGALIATETATGDGSGEFPLGGNRFTHQMAGAQYPRQDAAKAVEVLVSATGTSCVLPLIAVSNKPTFVCAQNGVSSLFVSTAQYFPHPEQQVSAEHGLSAFYDQLMPLIIFVRAVCDNFCWRGGWKGARLIIDDPLLRRSYGFLDFSRLFDSLQKCRYGATVAFIPWNHARTSVRNAPFFNQARDRFSVCVHGCDHTNNEYGSLDEDRLMCLSQLAMSRMQRHQDRTGLIFERVMVFPQGRFSTSSLRALKSNDFLAAVNSTQFPVDRQAGSISLGELLLPAVCQPYGFPVFGRHYPKSTFPFLFDLFLGRPAFIVEHHDFFKDGFPALENLVQSLNEREPALFWGSLSDTIQRTCWKREVSMRQWEVRFFSNKFSLTNDSNETISYRLLKEEEQPEEIASITLDRISMPIISKGNEIEIEMSLQPGQSTNVRVQWVPPLPRSYSFGGKVYDGKVMVRRGLSEFRDCFLAKHPSILGVAKRSVRLLRMDSSQKRGAGDALKQ